jgi:hypothetical protein
MAIWVRNLRIPDVGSAGGSALLIYIRELLRIARWTEASNNGDAAWPDVGGLVNNLVVTPADLSVNPLFPRRITSLSSPFTVGMVGYCIALLAVNDQNRSIWRITKYIDANNIEVDDQGFTPWNWIAESGITGRVTRLSLALTATTATCLWNSPAPNMMQARLLYSAADASILYVRPKGQVPLATECTGITYADSADLKHTMHMVADGPNVAIWWSTEDVSFEFVMWGKLLDADTADSDPNFIIGRAAAEAVDLVAYPMYMLDGANANIIAYPTFIKPNSYYSYDWGFHRWFNSRLANNGNAFLRSPWVCLANTLTVGACVRGRLPLIAQSYFDYERLRPMDAAGDWLHTYMGIMVPRNGPDDQLPLVPMP